MRACRPGDKRRRHPVAKIKGGWTEAEDDRLVRWAPGQTILLTSKILLVDELRLNTFVCSGMHPTYGKSVCLRSSLLACMLGDTLCNGAT